MLLSQHKGHLPVVSFLKLGFERIRLNMFHISSCSFEAIELKSFSEIFLIIISIILKE